MASTTDILDSSDGVKELEEDISELKTMLSKASRPNVRQELQRVMDTLEAELRRTKAKAATPDKSPQAAPASSPAAAAVAAPSEAPAAGSSKLAAAAPPAHKPVPIAVKSAGPWTEITTFALDLGGYDKPLVTVDIRLKGVESLPAENVTCDFTQESFDLKVVGLDGQNHRFLKTNLDKDIVPHESNVKVKKNHVIITLKKVKGEYGYDSWTDLCAKGKRKPTASKGKDANPTDSIMGMMQDLYEDGDDNMKQVIGEAMFKARRGEKYEPKDDLKTPSFDKMDDL